MISTTTLTFPDTFNVFPRLLQAPLAAFNKLRSFNGQTFSTLSYFPNELIHHIFQLAASTCPETCRALCEVSSWTRSLVLPSYIPTIIINTPAELDHLLGFPSRDPPSSSLWQSPLHFTRNLWVSPVLLFSFKRDPRQFMPGIMGLCPHLTSMALTGECVLALTELDVTAPCALDRQDLTLTIHPGGGNPEKDHCLFVAGAENHSHDHPILRRVTHLMIDNVLYLPQLELNTIAFPRLTHLAVGMLWKPKLLDQFLLSLSSDRRFQSLVIITYSHRLRELVLRLRPVGSRFGVYTPAPLDRERLEDWTKGVVERRIWEDCDKNTDVK